jgi:hypothetical protein
LKARGDDGHVGLALEFPDAIDLRQSTIVSEELDELTKVVWLSLRGHL